MEVFVLFIVSIISVVLSLFVIHNNPKSFTNRLFVFLNLTIFIWAIINNLSLQATNEQSAILWMRLTTFFAVPQAILVYLLVQNLPSEKRLVSKFQLLLLLFISAVTMLLTLSPWVFSNVVLTPTGYTPIVGPAMPVFSITVTIVSAMAITILIRRFIKSKGNTKSQLGYVLLGLELMLGLIIGTVIFPLIVYGSIFFVTFAPMYALLFLGFTAYAIVKHRLLELRGLVAKAVTYTIVLILIAFFYTLTTYGVITLFFHESIPFQIFILFSVLCLFIALSFSWIKRGTEKLTDKVFYRDHYDANDLLWSLSRIMASTLLLSDLSTQIMEKLLAEMKINYGAIVLIKNKSIFWVGSSGEVSKHPFDNAGAYTLVYDSYHTTKHNEHIFIFEELPEGKIKKLLRKQDLTIVIPLTVRHELIGGLMLGQKSSGEIYSSEDIEVLKIVAPEIAVAIRNALSFEEIRKFNITLENEVDRATKRLRSANHRLQELDHLKDEFVSIASHELRTPMTAIKSYLWMAINQPQQNIKEPLKKYLNISYNSTERLIRLVNDMLTVSRIERNKIELKKTPININEIAQLIYDELKITADEKNIKFTFDKPKKKIMINGDKDKLREVVQNIVGNALKFTPEKGEITITCEEKGNLVHLSVTDTASGIPKEELPNLFKKFSKIEYSYSKHSSQPGTGLGLYISKQIVSLHNGDIKVQSEVGVGSTFTVLLPLYKGDGGDPK